jgi:hypothetical protein
MGFQQAVGVFERRWRGRHRGKSIPVQSRHHPQLALGHAEDQRHLPAQGLAHLGDERLKHRRVERTREQQHAEAAGFAGVLLKFVHVGENHWLMAQPADRPSRELSGSK